MFLFSNTKIVTLGKNPAGFIPFFSTLDFFVYRITIILNKNRETLFVDAGALLRAPRCHVGLNVFAPSGDVFVLGAVTPPVSATPLQGAIHFEAAEKYLTVTICQCIS